MSGCITFRRGPEGTWTPPGWIFRNVLEGAAVELAGAEPAIAATLREATEGFEYVDASGWTDGQVSHFLDAVLAVEAKWRVAGQSSFARPEFYPGFMDNIAELVSSIRWVLGAGSPPKTPLPE